MVGHESVWRRFEGGVGGVESVEKRKVLFHVSGQDASHHHPSDLQERGSAQLIQEQTVLFKQQFKGLIQVVLFQHRHITILEG